MAHPVEFPRKDNRRAGVLRRLARTTMLCGTLAGVSPAVARVSLPSPGDGQVAEGVATINRNGSTLTVTLDTQRSVINWTNFSVGQGQTANFKDGISSGSLEMSVLNRVIGDGSTPAPESQILGSLRSDANVSVFLLNPSGVLFGAHSVVSTGSLIVSTLDIGEREFQSGSPYHFQPFSNSSGGASPMARQTGGITVQAGAQITALGKSGLPNLGRIAMIGVQVTNNGTLKAENDIALLAATDVVVTMKPNSPMAVEFVAGTPMSGKIVANGNISGQNVLIAAASQQDVTDALLSVGGAITATSATPTDRGVLLVAGDSSQSAPGVTFFNDSGANNTGTGQIKLGGSLTATGAGVTLLSSDGILAPDSGAKGAIQAAGNVLALTDAGGIAFGDATATTGKITVRAAGGDLALGDLKARNAILLTAPGDVMLGSASSGSSSADITIQGASLSSDALSAGHNLLVTTDGTAAAGKLSAGKKIDVSASSISASTATAGGDLKLASTSGGLTLTGKATAGGNIVFKEPGAVSIDDAKAQGAIAISGTTVDAGDLGAAGNLRVTGDGEVTLGGAASSGWDVTINSGAVANTGDLGGVNVVVKGASVSVGSADASGSVLLTASNGKATLGSATAGTDVRVKATDAAQVNGAVTAGHDYDVTGSSVTLGTSGPVTQKAARNVDITSTAGDITGIGGIILQADSDGDGVGKLTLDANGGNVNFDAASHLLGGTVAGRTGKIEVDLQNGATLQLGAVDARAFETDASGDIHITGHVVLDRSLTLSTTGDITVGQVHVTDRGAHIALDGNSVTATGRLHARHAIDIESVGDINVRGLWGSGNDVTLDSKSGDITARGIKAGREVTALASGDITLGRIHSLRAGTDIEAASGDVVAGSITAKAKVLVSAGESIELGKVITAGGVNVQAQSGVVHAGDVSAGGDVTIEGQRKVALHDVASSGGAVSLTSNAGSLRAGAISATDNISAAARNGVSLANADSSAGHVVLSSRRRTLAVAGAVSGATGVTADARGTVTLGDVSASGGGISLTSRRDAITAGQLSAAGDIQLAANDAIGLAGANSSGGKVVLVSSAAGVQSAGAIAGRNGVNIKGAGDLALGTVSSGAGTVSLTSGGAIGADGVTGSGGVKVKADGNLALGDVGASQGEISLVSQTGTITTGMLTARQDISAKSALLLDVTGADAGGAVSLVSKSAGVTVGGALLGAKDVLVSGDGALVLRDVTATAGRVTLLSSSDGITAGALSGMEGVRVAGAGAVTLGQVDSSAGAVHLTSHGDALGAGPITAVGDITAAAAGAIGLNGANAGGALSVASSGGGVTSTGVLAGQTGVIVRGADALSLQNVVADAGAIRLVSVDGGITAGAVSGQQGVYASGVGLGLGDVTASGGALTLRSAGDLTAGAVAASGDILIRGADAVKLSTVASSGGAVTLGSRTATLAAGTISAQNDVDASSHDEMVLGDVRSTAGAIDLTSSHGNIRLDGAGGAAGQGDATGLAGVTITAAGPVRFAAATSDDGDVTISSRKSAVHGASLSAGGQVTVNAAAALTIDGVVTSGTFAGASGRSTTLSGRAAMLGGVDSGGALTITVGGGDLVAGPLVATGDISAQGAADARFSTVTSTGGGVGLGASGDLSSRDILAGGGAITVSSGKVTLAALTANDAVGVTGTGAVAVRGAVTAGSTYEVTGASVVLGQAGTAILQQAEEGVAIQSSAGDIRGIAGLTLLSDAGRNGAGDLILRSAGGIDFAQGTTLGAGSSLGATGDGIDAVRVALGSGRTLTLDRVDAGSLVSYDPNLSATALVHDGNVRLGVTTIRDTLDIQLDRTGGAATLTLAGPVTSRTGGIHFSVDGAINGGTLDAAGAIDVAGATVTLTDLTGGSVAGRATGGALRVGQVIAQVGAIDLDARTALRLAGASATGDIDLGAGTIISRADGSAVDLASGGAVTVATHERGIGGVVRLGTVDATDDIAVTGNSIHAAALTSSAGGVTITSRRADAAETGTSIAIGTIDAANDIVFAGGRGVAVSGASSSIALDRATSADGRIRITDSIGGIRGLDQPATDLFANGANGAILVDVGGRATLGTVQSSGPVTVHAAALRLARATSVGDLDLVTDAGAMTVGEAHAGHGSATFRSAADLTISDAVTAGRDLALTAAGSIAAPGRMSAGRDVTATAARDLTAGQVKAGRDATLTAEKGTLDVGQVKAGGTVALTGDDGAIKIGTIRTAGAIDLTGTLVDAHFLDAGTTLDVTATKGGITLDRGRAGDAATLTATRAVQVQTLGAGGDIGLTGASVTGGHLTAGGTLDATAQSGDLQVARAIATGDMALAAGGAIQIGAAMAGADVDLISGGATGITTLVAAGGNVRATAAGFTAPTVTAGGAIGITTRAGGISIDDANAKGTSGLVLDLVARGGAITLGAAHAGGDAALKASGAIDATSLRAGGSLRAQAGTLSLDTVTAGDTITLLAPQGGTIGTATAGQDLTIADTGAGTMTIGAARAIRGDLMFEGADAALSATALVAGGEIGIDAAAATIGTATAGGKLSARLGAGPSSFGSTASGASTQLASMGDLTLGTATTGGDLALRSNGDVSVTGDVSAKGDYQITASTIRLGSAGGTATHQQGAGVTLRSTSGDINGRSGLILVAAGGDLQLTAHGDVTFAAGTALRTTAGDLGIDALGAARIAGDVSSARGYDVTADRIVLGTGATTATQHGESVALTSGAGGITGLGSLVLASRDGPVTLRSGGDILFKPATVLSAVGGDFTADAAGAVTLATVDAHAGLTIASGGDLSFEKLVSGGAASLTSRDGDLTLGTATTGGGLSLDATAGTVSVTGPVDAAGAYTINAGAIVLGSASSQPILQQGASVSMHAGIGDIEGLGALMLVSTSGSLGLSAARGVTFAPATVLRATGGDLSVTAGAGATLATVDASQAAAVRSGGDLVLTTLAAGGAAALTSTGGDLSLGTAQAGSLSLTADAGTASLSNAVSSRGAYTIDAGAIVLGSASSPILQRGASVSMHAGIGDIEGLGALTLTSTNGGLVLTAARNVTFGLATVLKATGGDLSVTAGASTTLATVDAGQGASVRSGSDLVLASLTAGRAAALTSTGGDLSLGTAQAGSLSLTADAGAASVSGAVSSKGAYTIDAGAIVLGSASSPILQRGASVSMHAGMGDIQGLGALTLVSTSGSLGLSAARDVTFAPATVLRATGGDLSVTAGAGATLAAVDASQAATIHSGGNLALAALTAGGAAAMTSTAGDLSLGTAQAGSLSLTADAGTASVSGAVSSRGAYTIDAGAIVLGDGGLTGVTQSGASILLTSLSGGVSGLGALTLSAASGPLTIASAGNVTFGAGSRLRTGGEGEAITVSAKGDLALATVISSGGLILTAGGNASVVGDATAAGAYSIDANGITLGAPTAQPITQQAASVALTSGSGGITGLGALTLASTGGGVSLNSGGNVDFAPATTMRAAGGDLAVKAMGAAVLATVDAGRALTATAGNGLALGPINSGGDATLTATGGDLTLASATTGGALTLSALDGVAAVNGNVVAKGAYKIDAGAITIGAGAAQPVAQQATTVAFTSHTGDITDVAPLTLTATAGSLTIAAAGDANLAPATLSAAGSDPATGDAIAIMAGGTARLGSVTAANQQVAITAGDVELNGAVTGSGVTLANNGSRGSTQLGDQPNGNGDEFGADSGGFMLSSMEIGDLHADRVVIDSGAKAVSIGDLALSDDAGRSLFQVESSGAGSRIDVLGALTATGTGDRQIVLGGDASGDGAARADVIRVAATSDGGGRLLVGGATLDLRGGAIGIGQDQGFLASIGFGGDGRSASLLSVGQVGAAYVSQPQSALYNAQRVGAQPYTNAVLVQAGKLVVHYSQYALVQNTAPAGQNSGVVLGDAATPSALALVLDADNAGGPNAFALYGTIDGIAGKQAALAGPDVITELNGVTAGSSRANGCIIGSGAGCLNTSIAQPTLDVFDTSRAEIFRTADDLTLPFDPLVGTNNEALYADLDVEVASNNESLFSDEVNGKAAACGQDKARPCPTPETHQ